VLESQYRDEAQADAPTLQAHVLSLGSLAAIGHTTDRDEAAVFLVSAPRLALVSEALAPMVMVVLAALLLVFLVHPASQTSL
jgi:hypothetical protein